MNRYPLRFEWKVVTHSISFYSCRMTSSTVNQSRLNSGNIKEVKGRINNKDFDKLIKARQKQYLSSGVYCSQIKMFNYIMPSMILQGEKLYIKRKFTNRQYSTNNTNNLKSTVKTFAMKVNSLSGMVKLIVISGVAGGLIALLKWYIDSEDSRVLPVSVAIVDDDTEQKHPEHSNEIPDKVQYLLIGGGTAAFSACRSIKSKDAFAQILILSEEPHYPYMKPPLSKELFSSDDRKHIRNLQFVQWNGVKRSLFYEPDDFFLSCSELNNAEYGGIAVARGWKAISVDPLKKLVMLDDGKLISYEKCLLATGSSPIEFPLVKNLPNSIQTKISYFHTLSDFQKLDNILEEDVKSVAIYGGGLLGCELACSLAKRGKENDFKITQIVETSNVMSDILPGYLCDWLSKKIIDEGIEVLHGNTISDLTVKNQLKIMLSNGKNVEADHLIICTGAKPNTLLAESSGLEIDPVSGGFLVNPELVARSHLYAAGDCASYYDSLLNKRRTVFHYDHAIASGRLAGENMTGAGKPMTHQGTFWTEIGPTIGLEGVGNINSNLETVAVFANKKNGESVSVRNDDSSTSRPEEYAKGIIFYLGKNKIVEGVLFWNVYNRLGAATQLIKKREQFNDLYDVAKVLMNN